jgi:hypothetical protein
MHGYTVDEIMATRPCADYPRERVEELWGGRESLTVVEIAALDIPLLDRLYQVIRLLPLESIPVLARRYADDAPSSADADDAAIAAATFSPPMIAAVRAFNAAIAAALIHADSDAALERYLGWAVEAHH